MVVLVTFRDNVANIRLVVVFNEKKKKRDRETQAEENFEESTTMSEPSPNLTSS